MPIIILRGIPGSGKSTFVRERIFPKHSVVHICSTDDYFTDPKTGKYTYNLADIGRAHAQCLQLFNKFITNAIPEELREEGEALVVDNTNSGIAEMAPYAAFAVAYGHPLHIVTLVVNDPIKAWRRNTHGVPLKTCLEMHKRLMTDTLPPWWQEELIPVEL